MAKREYLESHPFVPRTSRLGVKNDIALIQRNGHLSNAGTGQIFDQERYQLLRVLAKGRVQVSALERVLSTIPWPGGPTTERAHIDRIFDQIAMLDNKAIRSERIRDDIFEFPDEKADIVNQYKTLDEWSKKGLQDGPLFSDDGSLKTETVRQGLGIIFATQTRSKLGYYIEDLRGLDKAYITGEDIRKILSTPFTQDIHTYREEMDQMLADPVYTLQQKRDLKEGFLWFGFQLFGPAFRYRIALEELIDQAKQLSPRETNTQSRRSIEGEFEYPSKPNTSQTKAEAALRRHHHGTRAGRTYRPLDQQSSSGVPLSLEDEARQIGYPPIYSDKDGGIHLLLRTKDRKPYIHAAMRMDGIDFLVKKFRSLNSLPETDNIKALRNFGANVGDGIIMFYQDLVSEWNQSYNDSNKGIATKIPFLKDKVVHKAEKQADSKVLQMIRGNTDITFTGDYNENLVGAYILEILQPIILMKRSLPKEGEPLYGRLKELGQFIKLLTIEDAVIKSFIIDNHFQNKVESENVPNGNESLQIAWRVALELLQLFDDAGALNRRWENKYASEIHRSKEARQRNLLKSSRQ